jgi:hypothetical protein
MVAAGFSLRLTKFLDNIEGMALAMKCRWQPCRQDLNHACKAFFKSGSKLT